MSRYTTVRVPVELRNVIKSLARRRKMPMWKIVHEAVTYYRSAYLTHFREFSGDLNKISWYTYKLSASVGELRANPTKENLQLLLTTISQLEERLGVNAELLRAAAERYVKKPERRERIQLNDAAKDVVAQIIEKIR